MKVKLWTLAFLIGSILISFSFLAPPSCVAGFYDNNGICTPCERGSVQGMPGQTECIDCVPGTYQGEEGQLACFKCELGRFSNVSKAVACEECPIGFYQDERGSIECKPCGENRTTLFTGASNSSQCIPVIPTLSQWTMLILGLCMTTLALIVIRSRISAIN